MLSLYIIIYKFIFISFLKHDINILLTPLKVCVHEFIVLIVALLFINFRDFNIKVEKSARKT